MLNLMTSTAASTARKWRGTSAQLRTQQPEKPLRLYDLEGCPFCRPVRECLTELDLDAHIYPCPKGAPEYWQEVKTLGGTRQVPFLYDENTDTRLYGSDEITRYLIEQYGDASAAKLGKRPSSGFSSKLTTAMRAGAGLRYRPARQPAQPLELFSFESSPFSRVVRETLAEMGIAYHLRNGGKQQRADIGLPWLRPTTGPYQPLADSKRAELLKRTGKVQFPYLYDPNTGTGLFESKDIVRYLKRTYGE